MYINDEVVPRSWYEYARAVEYIAAFIKLGAIKIAVIYINTNTPVISSNKITISTRWYELNAKHRTLKKIYRVCNTYMCIMYHITYFTVIRLALINESTRSCTCVEIIKTGPKKALNLVSGTLSGMKLKRTKSRWPIGTHFQSMLYNDRTSSF